MLHLIGIAAESFQSLGKNRVRTSLATLGIVIGIASVITMVAMGEGTKRRVEREIAALGDDWMFVFSWGMTRGGVRGGQGVSATLTTDDAEAVLAQCTYVRAATPSNMMRQQVSSQFTNYQSPVIGAYASFFDIRRWTALVGRTFTDEEDKSQAKVCCIGMTAARELFGSVNPVGETIRVNRVPFKIIGLLTPKGSSSEGRDYDDIIVFPFRVFQRKIAGLEKSATMLVAAKPGIPMSEVQAQVRRLLRERHRLAPDEPDDFRIRDQSEPAEVKAETSESFSQLLLVIASVSLVVGGVGIMNIMLVSVTERTREIGLRMAIGANALHILGQFLFEAILLCVAGGLTGLALGVGAAYALEQYKEWETVITPWSVSLAVAFSLLVGLFFGFYPAWRASRLDPIDALRFE
ncbi:MAG: ABC transporter permease [Phycisphaerae bacterium]|nr:ABC transporter permease [Phycisphaerae bacterium]